MIDEIYPIGTETRFGKVAGIQREGSNPYERYYFLIDKDGAVSYIPQCAMKQIVYKRQKKCQKEHSAEKEKD